MPLTHSGFTPRRLWVTPSIPLPASLDTISHQGKEAAMPTAQQQAIWKAMHRFYHTGMNPGMTLAIRHRGELVFNRAIGYADVATRTPLSVDAPVCLFSASKAVTAVIIHALAEQGKLALTDKVTTYLPAFAANGKGDTTLLDLLAHRAGIPRLPDANPELLFHPKEGLQAILAAAPETEAGKRQAYHAITAGYVLAAIAEKVTGQSLNTLLDEMIRQPLGMTYFHYGMKRSQRHLVPKHYLTGLQSRWLDHYITHAVGTSLKQVVEVSNDPRFMDTVVPAGNLYATAEETTRFYQMLLQGGRWNDQQILQPATIKSATRRISRPITIDGSLLLPLRFSAGFMLGARALSLYGPGTRRAFGHLGFISITTWADPERQLSVALLTTGKGVLGPQFPAMINLFNKINRLH